MNLPDFLIIGAARCGTSSLHRNLELHPKICGPENLGGNKKEVHFFDRKYRLGLDWYSKQFPAEKNGRLFFESTPNYLYQETCPKLIKRHLPDAKFIVMLRNPIDRAWSHFWHWKNKLGWTEQIFNNKDHIVIQKGIYIDQLKRWRKCFSETQFMWIQSEMFFKDPQIWIDTIFCELDLEEIQIKNPIYYDPVREKAKKKDKYPQMPRRIRQKLSEFYKSHNEKLYDFLKIDFGWDK